MAAEDLSGAEDLCTLPQLSDSTILSCLEQRYKQDKLCVSYMGGGLSHKALPCR